MKTEVSKNYKHGFVLSETELRRLIKTCSDHLLKSVSTENAESCYEAALFDGSIIETENIDDILRLENTGSKRIKKLSLLFSETKEQPDYLISINFNNAEKDSESWKSIKTNVIGTSRDWAFLAAADIEERIKKIKKVSFIFVTSSKVFTIIPMIVTMCVMIPLLNFCTNRAEPVDKLEKAYHDGTIKDAIEAIIFIEREKIKNDFSFRYIIVMIAAFIIPWLVLYGGGKLLHILSPAYNFYWGDYIAYFDKKKTYKNIFWTVIVLGIIVSIISAYILRVLP